MTDMNEYVDDMYREYVEKWLKNKGRRHELLSYAEWARENDISLSREFIRRSGIC